MPPENDYKSLSSCPLLLGKIKHSNGGLITFPDGVPLKDKVGNIVGAIGVSGSLVENDNAVAEAGVQALLN